MKVQIRTKEYHSNTIKISGSKNSALPIIAAALLCDEDVTIRNIPNISDIKTLISIIKGLNCAISFLDNTIYIKKNVLKYKKLKDKNITKLRGSYYLLGSLIGLKNDINLSCLYPGGCKFGKRPINYHLNAFKQMNLKVKTIGKKIIIKGNKKVVNHHLEYPSIGTTINIILASSKATGKTIIYNAALEPEVIDVCNFINSMGGNIKVKDNREIEIDGVSYLHSTNYKIISDRIEAGTFLILGALHKGIKITNIDTHMLTPVTDVLYTIGCNLIINKKSIILKNDTSLKPFNLEINPYPSFPTDLGPLMCVLASKISGTSTIIENIYPDRLSHIPELQKLNINIKSENNIINITGINKIKNTEVTAHDLRCAATLILAASLSSSFSTIYHIEHLFRGYEDIKKKLNSLGIDFIIGI